MRNPHSANCLRLASGENLESALSPTHSLPESDHWHCSLESFSRPIDAVSPLSFFSPFLALRHLAMAPPRQRTAAIVDDSRSEASSGTREYKSAAPKRKTATAKDKATITSAPIMHDHPVDDQPRVCTDLREPTTTTSCPLPPNQFSKRSR